MAGYWPERDVSTAVRLAGRYADSCCAQCRCLVQSRRAHHRVQRIWDAAVLVDGSVRRVDADRNASGPCRDRPLGRGHESACNSRIVRRNVRRAGRGRHGRVRGRVGERLVHGTRDIRFRGEASVAGLHHRAPCSAPPATACSRDSRVDLRWRGGPRGACCRGGWGRHDREGAGGNQRLPGSWAADGYCGARRVCVGCCGCPGEDIGYGEGGDSARGGGWRHIVDPHASPRAGCGAPGCRRSGIGDSRGLLQAPRCGHSRGNLFGRSGSRRTYRGARISRRRRSGRRRHLLIAACRETRRRSVGSHGVVRAQRGAGREGDGQAPRIRLVL